MKNTYKKIITPLYVINIVFQAFITLISPICVMFLLSYLCVKYLSLGNYIYVIFILIGVFSGLYSMVIFIIRASRAAEAIEKQNSPSEEGNKNKNGFK